MENIENLAIETYQKNLEYFAKDHKDIMKLLSVFDMAQQNGDHDLLYDLEYLDGYFDIKIISSQKYLYGTNSVDTSKELAKRVNLKKDSYMFEGLPIYNFSEESLKNVGEEIKFIDGIFPLMRYYSQNSKETDLMKSIEKYIFIGTGLGTHIELIDEKISARHYLIVEDDLEIFKLSLFTTKYYEIAKDSKLYFSIADDENMFLKTVHNFLEADFFDNRYLKYTYLPTHSNNKIKQIQNALTTQAFIFFPYKAELYKFLLPLEYINDGYNVINLITNLNTSLFQNKPALVIGAGPSFQKNIEWLKENHNRFIIIAASAVLNTLYKHNIAPDIITHLDGSIETVSHYEKMADTDFLQNTIMFFGANTRAEVRNMFSKEQIFYYEEGAGYFKDFGSISTPCVGSFSVILSLILNSQEVYLLGLDLALNQETGETHSSEHLYSKKADMDDKDTLKSTMGNQNNIFPVQGNFTDTVYTNPLLHASIQSLYRHIPTVKQNNQTIYNLNEGAKINQTIPTHISDINIFKYDNIDKKQFFESTQKVLEANSTKSLSEEDTASMKQRLVNAKIVYENIQQYTNDVSHTNFDRYFYDLLGLASDILHRKDRESSNLSHVYLQYFKFALSIVSDMFNTKGLKNEKRHIKKIDKMIQNEMCDICEIYIENLDKFVKERC